MPEGKTVKNRLHLDVNATDREQDEEVRRLLDLGARHADVGRACLADPEGIVDVRGGSLAPTLDRVSSRPCPVPVSRQSPGRRTTRSSGWSTNRR